MPVHIVGRAHSILVYVLLASCPSAEFADPVGYTAAYMAQRTHFLHIGILARRLISTGIKTNKPANKYAVASFSS